MFYKAFISYSHAADAYYAPSLQSSLHKFAKPFYLPRRIRVFRDQTDLSANPALWPVIQKALDESEYFLYLASPKAAGSKWVKREIDYWLKRHEGVAHNFIIVWTDGGLEWDSDAGDFDWAKTDAMPRILDWDKKATNPTSLEHLFAEEPHYVDHRWVKTEKDVSLRNPRFLDGIATLAATLHGKPKSDLIGEDVSEHNRYKNARSIAIGLLAVFALLAGGFAFVANQMRVRAEDALRQETLAKQEAEQRRRSEAEQRAIAQNKTAEAERLARSEAEARDNAEERRREAQKQAEIAREQRQEAEKQAKIAEEQREEARKQASIAESRRIEAERQTRIANEQRQEAERQSEIALGRQLAAQSEASRTTSSNLQRSAILATESMRRLVGVRTPSVEADQALRRSLSLLPRPVAGYAAAVVSPNGRYLLTKSGREVQIRAAVSGVRINNVPLLNETDLLIFNTDGERFATVSGRNVRVWETASGRNTAGLTLGEGDRVIALNAQGNLIATANTTTHDVDDETLPTVNEITLNEVRLWDTNSGRLAVSASVNEIILFAAFHPDGKHLTLVKYHLSGGGLRRFTRLNTLAVPTLEFEGSDYSPSPTAFVKLSSYRPYHFYLVLSQDGGQTVFELRSKDGSPGEVVRMVSGRGGLAQLVKDSSTLTFTQSENGQFLAITSKGGHATIKNTLAAEEKTLPLLGEEYVVAVSDNGAFAALERLDHSMRLVEVSSGRETDRIVFKGSLRHVHLDSDGRGRLLSESDNKTYLWQAEGFKEQREVLPISTQIVPTLNAMLGRNIVGSEVLALDTMQLTKVPRVDHEGLGGDRIYRVAFTSDRAYMATLAYFGDTLYVWKTATGERVARIPAATATRWVYGGIIFRPGGRELIIFGKKAEVWSDCDTNAPRLLRTLPYEDVMYTAFSGDGKLMAVAVNGYDVRVVEFETGREVARLQHNPDEIVRGLVFSRGNETLAAYTTSGKAMNRSTWTWDYSSGRLSKGMPLADTYQKYSIVAWGIASGRLLFRGYHALPENTINSIAISPGGDFVATSSNDKSARVWETLTGREVARVPLQDEQSCISFNQDGTRLTTGSWTDPPYRESSNNFFDRVGDEDVWVETKDSPTPKTVQHWLWEPGHLLAEACSRLSNAVTETELTTQCGPLMDKQP